MQHYSRTAILLFSRSPRQEALHKQLAGSHSYRVSKALLQHSIREAKRSGIEVCTILGPQQHGHTFGERLANAAEDVFSRGFDQLIIIGSDSPELSAALIQKAHAQLRTNQVVLGPAKDGGFYLIGLSALAYQREAFIRLAWETDQLQTSVQSYLQELALSAHFLPTLLDLDTAQHFAEWHPTLGSGRLFSALQKALQLTECAAIFFRYLSICGLHLACGNPTRRGPPTAIPTSV